jgi:CheY-like chemotaxis protein
VLVIEDDATNRLLVRAMLRRGPVVLTEAKGGLEAMDAAAARRFDLLLMDVSMPG